jgi:hypothetical protein
VTPDQPAPNLHHLNFAPFVQERAMNRDPEKLRRELADLVNEQADTAEIETLTDEERRRYEERQELINELCDELHRIATTIHMKKQIDALGKETFGRATDAEL